MWQRRTFLKAAGVGFLSSLSERSVAAFVDAELVFASSCRFANGQFGVALLNENGQTLSTLDLPGRGHDITHCPVTGRLVAFARRPGTFAVVFDAAGNSLDLISAHEGRHFFGHGVFSGDGNLLYTTENQFDEAQGIIGIYDATNNFARIGEFSSGGMDPHDILLIDNRTLCVANGGIETHPDYGRQKLNLSTMKPNLSWIDPNNGALIAQHKLPSDLHQVSLRHLAKGSGKTIWVGAQYQGISQAEVPLLMFAGPDTELQMPTLPPNALRALSNYVGSVVTSDNGQTVVATSPVGNAALVFDVASGNFQILGHENVCGASFARSTPILTTGNGDFVTTETSVTKTGVQFDNHLLTLAQNSPSN